MGFKSSQLVAYINVEAIVHNCTLLRQIGGNRKLCVAIKANAYGHGVEAVLSAMEKANVDFLATANIEEAIELRSLNWTKPILIFGSEFSIYSSNQKRKLANIVIQNNLRITPSLKDDIEILNQSAHKLNSKAKVHLQFDSGMSRMGLLEDEFFSLLEYCIELPFIEIEGIYTHFANADAKDKSFTYYQLERFNKIVKHIKTKYKITPIIHAANSSATIDIPESHFDMIRPGISVYGYHSSPEMHNKPDLKPAMKLVGKITFIKKLPLDSFVGYGCTFRTSRETIIGIVPIGYADGYSRKLSNKGMVLIENVPVPVIGRVSMDQAIVDLTDIIRSNPSVTVGTEATIIDDDRTSPNSVENLAQMLDTIPNEIVTAIGPRVKRAVI